MIVQWQNLTSRRIDALDRDRCVVLVSCSPLEVHGPHLPVSADMTESEGLLVRTAEMLGERHPEITFVHLPPVFVATDVLPRRGSIKFSAGTVVRVLTELGTSLARQGFTHIWVGNFHGGPRHFIAIEQAADDVNRRTGARMLSVFGLLVRELTGGSSDMASLLGGIGGVTAEELRGDAHGGLIETALLLHLARPHVAEDYASLPPRSIDAALRERGRAPLQQADRPTMLELVRSFPIIQRYYEVETYAGRPGKATAELGEAYLDRIAGESALVLEEVWTGRLHPRDCHSPLWPLRHVLLSRPLGWLFDRLVPSRPSPV